ncbi:unnamed protein product [Didymodactylos carnosus]|uniref:Uncharacterized protein n=2 Tax=Didymodactylos carnosus TaxID=1234261 RepID=A0A8S2RC81_9BILA|nr:unnamed protein product [Didymodactylos carnosus]CAF4151368.1 unnamed protein product [Didymodactylos carnosus]
MQPKAVIILTKPNDYWTQINRLMNGYKKSVKYNINYQQQLAKRRYDKERANPVYHPGDLVFIKQHSKRPKFGELYSAPYKVIQQQHPHAYLVEDEESSIQEQVHVSRIQPVYQRMI